MNTEEVERRAAGPQTLPGTSRGKGPQQGDSYGHAYCMKCNRVIYNMNMYGPKTPAQINRTFCICNGRVTGIVQKTRKVYGIEDINRKDFLRP